MTISKKADGAEHSPPGPYVLFDNLVEDERLVLNVWTEFDPNSFNDGLYMRYLYMNCKGHSLCINLWTLDFIEISDDINTAIEWGTYRIQYPFDDALKNRNISFNGSEYTYYEFIPYLQSNKKIRDVVFASGDIKELSSFCDNDSPFEYYHQLVVDEKRPVEDLKWDISTNVNVRFRIEMKVHLSETHRMDIQFDMGARGMPTVQPVGWFPTRDMDGILISSSKAVSLPNLTYLNNSVSNSCMSNS
jgi:hypothetical protein